MTEQLITPRPGISYTLDQHITTPRRSWRDTAAGQAMLRRRREERAAQERLLSLRVGIGQSSDRYSGVRLNTALRWEVSFSYHGEQHYAGAFDTEDEAGRAHDDYCRAYCPGRALNFEDEEATA